MINFFLPMNPPTVTQQEHDFKVVRGRVVVYDPPRLRDARQKFTALLAKEAWKAQRAINGEPMLPLEGPIRLVTKWLFPTDDEHDDGQWKISPPDTDNLIKLFKDCMTRTGWWLDDAQVCSEITEKFYADRPGIYVRVERIIPERPSMARAEGASAAKQDAPETRDPAKTEGAGRIE